LQDADADERIRRLRGEAANSEGSNANAPQIGRLDRREDREVDIELRRERRGRDEEKAIFDRRSSRQKRKRTGEDDTDFEMRLALERSQASAQVSSDALSKQRSRDGDIVGPDGHISLFDAPVPPREPNAEAEKEKARKKREEEDQYRMRFTNAAGKDGIGLMDGGPWYVKNESRRKDKATGNDFRQQEKDFDAPTTDAFGRDDPGRKAREMARISSGDPLAAMKKGAAKVREVKAERRQFAEEKARELEELRREERRNNRRKRRDRERRGDDDSLDGFRLDALPHDGGHDDRRRSEYRHRGQRRHRDDSRGRRGSSSPAQRSRYDDERRYRRDTQVAT
jgi:hypothetical protein